MTSFNQQQIEKQQINKVLKPILYADIFDYPLTLEEVYKYLEFKTTLKEVKYLLDQAILDKKVSLTQQFYTLPHRINLVNIRQKRLKSAQRLWPKAIYYARLIATIPFIKMVALTGSLSVNNPRDGIDDIDYLIVTRTNRLWLCRAIIIMLVKYTARQNIHLCPNYIITEDVISFEETNLYTAREMLQMIPLYGKDVYLKMREVNPWVTDFLPQADCLNLDKIDDNLSFLQKVAKKSGEFILGSFVGNLIEKQLQKIQINKHTRLAAQSKILDKVLFTADVCKGHYNNHNKKTMMAYEKRVQDYKV